MNDSATQDKATNPNSLLYFGDNEKFIKLPLLILNI